MQLKQRAIHLEYFRTGWRHFAKKAVTKWIRSLLCNSLWHTGCWWRTAAKAEKCAGKDFQSNPSRFQRLLSTRWEGLNKSSVDFMFILNLENFNGTRNLFSCSWTWTHRSARLILLRNWICRNTLYHVGRNCSQKKAVYFFLYTQRSSVHQENRISSASAVTPCGMLATLESLFFIFRSSIN